MPAGADPFQEQAGNAHLFAARRGAALSMLASRGVAESEGAEPWPRLSHFWAGAVGGTVGILATCPLEVIKTRAQSSHSKVGPSIVSTLKYIARTEGVAGLWRGLGPSVGGVAPSRAIYFGCYSYFKDAIPEVGLAPSVRDFAAAGASGCTVATLTSPVWVLKTRIQLQSMRDPAVAQINPQMRNYASYGDAVSRILREEGMAGFYKGLTASYWNVIEGAIQLALYQRLKSASRPWYGASSDGASGATLHEDEDLPKSQLFALAAGAKLLASSLTYPLEVVRTRLREQRTAYGADPKCVFLPPPPPPPLHPVARRHPTRSPAQVPQRLPLPARCELRGGAARPLRRAQPPPLARRPQRGHNVPRGGDPGGQADVRLCGPPCNGRHPPPLGAWASP